MIEYSREFIYLSRCMNFVKAARELNVSQPTLSRHIVDLENQLGFKLFTRNPLELTPAGRYYLESISGIIEQIDVLVAQGREIASNSAGTLVISMVPFDIGIYSNIVYESIAKLRESDSRFRFEFSFSRNRTMFESVCAGEADVGVIFDMPTQVPEGVTCERLLEFPCMIWAHRDNPATQLAHPEVADFADCRLVASLSRRFEAFFEAEVATLKRMGLSLSHRVKDIESMADFFVTLQPDEIKITSAMGIACPYNPHVVGVRIDDPRFSFGTYLVYRNDAAKPSLNRFVHMCRVVAEKYSSSDGLHSVSPSILGEHE